MLTPSERKVRERVALLVRERIDDLELVAYRDTSLPRNSLSSFVCDLDKDILLSRLVRVADALNCDVVINFRDRG
jgi:hypothetical protein